MTISMRATEAPTYDDDLIHLDRLLHEMHLNRERIPATATEPSEYVGFEVYYDSQTDQIVIESPTEQFKFPIEDGLAPLDKIERWLKDYEAEALVYIPF